MGISTVAVCSEADKDVAHVAMADEAGLIPPSEPQLKRRLSMIDVVYPVFDLGLGEMSKVFSLDTRMKVLAAVAAGVPYREVCEQFRVSDATVSRWRALERLGDVRPKVQGGDRRSARIEARKETVLATLESMPGVTVEELRQRLMEEGLTFGCSTIRRFLARHGIVRKSERGAIENIEHTSTAGAFDAS